MRGGMTAAALVLALLGCAAPSQPPDATGEPLRVGFSVGGAVWRVDLDGATNLDRWLELRNQAGFQDASLVWQLGGNSLRVFYADYELLGTGFPDTDRPVYRYSVQERLELLDRVAAWLASTQEAVSSPEQADQVLGWPHLDAYLDGVNRFNQTLGEPQQGVRVLLVHVAFAPDLIIECLSGGTLGYYGRSYTFPSLWFDYENLQAALMRRVVSRYLTRYRGQYPETSPLLLGIEVGNEPDYCWIPDEMRIAEAMDPSASPVDKYLTEMHFPQIPVSEELNRAFEPADWGYREQDIGWQEDEVETPVPAIDFHWGRKFDRYVRCFAQLHERLSWAASDQARQLGRPLHTVAASMTNCNLDYLIRMYRANPKAFTQVDAIALHPYHWPRHDIWATDFVSPEPVSGWIEASPREVALHYFKRFDFIREVARLTRITGEQSYGLAGKGIWITEFGIPTKKLGAANRGLEKLKLFLYERGEPVPEGIEAIVWEDKWDRFLDQVDRDFLVQSNVQAFFIYTLREGRVGHANDDAHSNFAIIGEDGKPRMDGATLKRLTSLLSALSGREPPE